MHKKARILFAKESEQVYKYLAEKSINSKTERTLHNSITDKLQIMRGYPNYGNNIPKKLIPKEYIVKYNITNIFRVEISHFWRIIYTLTESEDRKELIIFILDILNHKEYNNKFGYRKN